jgi:hypothetical protein
MDIFSVEAWGHLPKEQVSTDKSPLLARCSKCVANLDAEHAVAPRYSSVL